MEYGKPEPTTVGRYKMKVRVWDWEEKKDKIVYFGHRDYEDFTQHGDLKRRRSYLRRSAGIRNWRGQLTKDDPRSANYWSRRVLWASGERERRASP